MDRLQQLETIKGYSEQLIAAGWSEKQLAAMIDGLYREDAIEALERALDALPAVRS